MKSRILALTLIVALTSAIVCAGDNACGVSTEENFGFLIAPGESVEGYSNLDGTFGQGYYDVVWFIVLGAGNLNLQVEDCCIMGDVMIGSGSLLIGGPASYADWCISPEIISLDVGCPDFAIGYLLMAYFDAPGGFPAGYYWRASMGGDYDVVGTWELWYDWECDGDPGITVTNIYADGTWNNDQLDTGTWTLFGDQFTQYYDMGTVYYGTVAPGGTYMSGTMETTFGRKGCWEADKTALASNPASQGDSGDTAAGN